MSDPDRGSLRPGVASRLAAWRAVRRVHSEEAWASPAVAGALGTEDLDARDRGFAANLAFQTLRWEGTLDWALAQVSSRPLAQVDEDLLDVLRLGAWQILYGELPERAAVATAVEVARAAVGEHVAGFANGVLRGLVRRRSGLPWPPADSDEGLALRLGYPAWMVGEARGRFGDRAEAVLAAGNDPPGLTLRAVGDPDGLLAELRDDGYTPQRGHHLPEAVRLPGSGDPGRIAALAAGRATPQDEASMLVVSALAARVAGARAAEGSGARVAEGSAAPAEGSDAPADQEPGAGPTEGHGRLAGVTVLDACAAPGGKATHLAQLGAGVVAADVNPGRGRLITELAERLGLGPRVSVVAADGTRPPWRAGAFDAVLLDVPCTGLGVTRRRPELRWRRDRGDPARLGRLQLDLLEGASRAVRSGGAIVYSACTWTTAETVDVAQAFLAAHGDRFAAVSPDLPVGSRQPDDPGVQLAPDRDGVDGMYVAVFARTGAA